MRIINIIRMSNVQQKETAPAATWQRHAVEQPCISCAELFGERKEVLIEHGTELYRLRITRNGKLILTK